MFELEGTKHEKVVLVLLAYIIGITSGYIAFATQSKSMSVVYKDTSHQVSAVVETEMTDSTAGTEEEMGSGTVLGDIARSDEFVHYTNGRLIVDSPGLRMLISVHADNVGDDVQPGFEMQGIHVAAPVFVADEARENVFFCEFFTVDTECSAYIYNVSDVTIKPVVLNGEQLVLTEAEARTAAWTDGQFAVANLISFPREPWRLTIR